jgi:dTDP-4-dehydrorhamnose 3,5-epimerase
MSKIVAFPSIHGVKIAHLRIFADERGRFCELFRKEWFPERTWDIVQSNRSESNAGVLRGLHYHHRQVDYWHVAQGSIRVGLADLRRSSPTFGVSQVMDADASTPLGIFIPTGVAHGFYALTPATLLYIVDNYYDGGDELGVAWDDPSLAVGWNIDEPILSPRDRQNPRLHDIPLAELPE